MNSPKFCVLFNRRIFRKSPPHGQARDLAEVVLRNRKI